ncbi:MAG: flagellar hook-basal body complex protein [Desulfotomaculum sp.]|nr:flagellar hook-basal body complex protein [Desulfotomaculum sp.]
MLRSLYSGVAGLMSHRTRMDVIGNNIANVNTTSFKAGRANFQDVLYQTIKPGDASRNAAQVGTGVGIAGISTNFGQGALQSTGRTLDLSIQGEGFFEVMRGTQQRYTRDGIFFIDATGNIVTSNGDNLVSADATAATRNVIQIENVGTGTNLTVATLSIAPDGTITGTYTDGTDIAFIGGHNQIRLATFPNNEGLTKVGSNLFQEDTAVSGAVNTATNFGGTSTVAAGYLEMSNVDLSNEFVNMITTQRGFQANARTITVSDSLLEELVNLKR